ncbi:MAG: hypothetical protein E7473_00665 [Ruminococcaceae bacterium]|nr:hypothetical protein [Oscillospiraceae bacterium]
MKKLSAIILAIMLVISMLPTAFAGEATPEKAEYAITENTTYVCAERAVRNSSVSGGYYSAKIRYDTYDSVNYGSYVPYIAFPITAPNPGEYELQIKAYENLATSVAPAVYFIHESELLERNEGKDRDYGTTKARYVGGYSDDLREPIGYYDFSTASTTEYTSVKSASGITSTVIVNKTGTYYIVLCPENYSRAINPKVRDTGKENVVTDTFANGFVDANGAEIEANSSVQGGDAKYEQDIAIAGFAFKTPKGDREYVYNFNYEAFGQSKLISRDYFTDYTLDDIVTSKSARWAYSGWHYGYNGYIKQDHLLWNAYKGRAEGTLVASLILDIKAGTYMPTLEYITLPTGYLTDIYLTKRLETDNFVQYGQNAGDAKLASRANALTDAEKLGTIDMYSSSEKTAKKVLKKINIPEDGEYLLIFRAISANPNMSEGEKHVYGEMKQLKLTPVAMYAEDEELKGAFDYIEEYFTTTPFSTATVNTFTAKLGESADKDNAVITSKTVNLGETYTVNAPAAEEGYKFLYWAKGMSTDKKQIVSYNESYSFIPTVENTYLIAVYEPISGEDDVNKAEFYNANGQLIATLTESGTAPALPEMAGYNEATGWALYGTNEVIAAGDSVEVSGVKVYVAKFGTPKTVKVNGEDVKYGDKVSFTAAPAVGEIFKAWKKNGVIVSTAETYEFYAWKDCDVSAVYSTDNYLFTGKVLKILVDTFSAGDKTAVMAEFIGFEGAVEKGIMLGNKRYAMTTGASQFTIVNDVEETEIKGYAIFKDGTIVYDN